MIRILPLQGVYDRFCRGIGSSEKPGGGAKPIIIFEGCNWNRALTAVWKVRQFFNEPLSLDVHWWAWIKSARCCVMSFFLSWSLFLDDLSCLVNLCFPGGSLGTCRLAFDGIWFLWSCIQWCVIEMQRLLHKHYINGVALSQDFISYESCHGLDFLTPYKGMK